MRLCLDQKELLEAGCRSVGHKPFVFILICHHWLPLSFGIAVWISNSTEMQVGGGGGF